MIRAVLIRALVFALPFALYGAYLLLLRTRPQKQVHATPWTALFVTGLVLVAASFLFWRASESGGPGVYVPPHVANGAIVAGHMEKTK